MSRRLGVLPETRFCVSTSAAGRRLLLIVSLRAPEQVEVLVRRIEDEDSSATVVDCQFVLRLAKVHGRLLADDGRAVGVIPVNPWASDSRRP